MPDAANPVQLQSVIQEPQMTRRAMSLMDVLAPPGNDWLKELSRRRSELPAGVHIVRFGTDDDDSVADEERSRPARRQPSKAAA